MRYRIAAKTELIKEPAASGDIGGTGQPFEDPRPFHISEVPQKIVLVLAYVEMVDDQHHNAIKKAAQFLYSLDKKQAEYITQWQGGITVWDNKGESIKVEPRHWLDEQIKEIKAQYKTGQPHKQEAWEVWPSPYSQALLDGTVESFPPTEAGYRAACLASLSNDNPFVWAFVQSEFVQRHPDNKPLIDRAIRAGFIIHQNKVRPQKNRRGENQSILAYVSPLDIAKEKDYTVKYRGILSCNCEDHEASWQAQNGKEYPPPVQLTAPGYTQHYAPYLEKIGICCEHVIACVLRAKIRAYKIEERDRIIERRIHPNEL